jgi:pimeloyl-ACP methyl ester carboxylesterase
VVASDLPAHGSSGTGTGRLDEDGVTAWLGDLMRGTCPEAPAVVGHVLGGAIAARFAARHGDRLRALVLVDSLGLAPFRPSARFAARFLGFQARPNERTFERFMGQCAFDLDDLRAGMGDDWTSFVAYNLVLARGDGAKAAGSLFRRVGLSTIPAQVLDGIDVPERRRTSSRSGPSSRRRRRAGAATHSLPRRRRGLPARTAVPTWRLVRDRSDPVRDQRHRIERWRIGAGR